MFEFLLLALITTQEPISVQIYQEMADCQNAASELTAFAESNYTDLKWDADLLSNRLAFLIMDHNSKWEAVQIAEPKNDSLIELITNINQARNTAQEYDLPDLVATTTLMLKLAEELLQNEQRPVLPNEEVPEYLLSSIEVRYACIAVPT